MTADFFQLSIHTNQNGSSLEFIQKGVEAIIRQTSSPLSRLTSQRMMGREDEEEGGKEGCRVRIVQPTFKQAGGKGSEQPAVMENACSKETEEHSYILYYLQ